MAEAKASAGVVCAFFSLGDSIRLKRDKHKYNLWKGVEPMIPEPFLKALFVTVGLLSVKLLYDLVGQVRSWPGRAALHALAGIALLLTANALGAMGGLGVGLNRLTVPVSAVLGAPGVGLLWAVKYLL